MQPEPLFYEPAVLSARANLVTSALGSVFSASSGAAVEYRKQIEAAQACGSVALDYTYGEIDLQGFCAILDAVCAGCTAVEGKLWSEPETYADIGCGLGKSMLAAAAYFPSLQTAIGVDISPELCEAASGLLSSSWLECCAALPPRPADVMFRVDCADASVPPCLWLHSDLAFSYWNAMGNDIRKGIVRQARGLRKGAIFVTTRAPVAGLDEGCCAACSSHEPSLCHNWCLLAQEWVDFERLEHETVFIQQRR